MAVKPKHYKQDNRKGRTTLFEGVRNDRREAGLKHKKSDMSASNAAYSARLELLEKQTVTVQVTDEERLAAFMDAISRSNKFMATYADDNSSVTFSVIEAAYNPNARPKNK